MLVPADPEQAIIDHLSPFYATSTKLPQTLPNLFIRVLAAGGVQRDLVTDEFLVTLEAFGTLESTARQLLAEAIGRLDYAVETNGHLGDEVCYNVNAASVPSNYPNPDVPTHSRYIVTLTVVLRRRQFTP